VFKPPANACPKASTFQLPPFRDIDAIISESCPSKLSLSLYWQSIELSAAFLIFI